MDRGGEWREERGGERREKRGRAKMSCGPPDLAIVQLDHSQPHQGPHTRWLQLKSSVECQPAHRTTPTHTDNTGGTIITILCIYRIAGNFRGAKFSRLCSILVLMK